MHPVLLDRISEVDVGLGQVLHDSGTMAPFSVSPTIGKKIRGNILENETYWVRFCILAEELEEVFLNTLVMGLWNEPINLGDLFFQVEDVILGKQNNHVWSGRESYEELLNKGSCPKKISLGLTSPISFKRGNLHYPLPDPSLIFNNLARRWNLFSPLKLPQQIDCTDVSFALINIQTEPFPLRKGGTVLGASGRLTFIFDGTEQSKRYYQALLRFAFYAGVGVKTTQGMGMCRIIDKE
jgi:CRISPR-associated endoribonuclease Cas6